MKKFLIAIVSLIAASAIGWQLLGFYWKYEYGQKAPKIGLTVSEVSRHYYLFVPDNLTEPAPSYWRFTVVAVADGAFLNSFCLKNWRQLKGLSWLFQRLNMLSPTKAAGS